MLDYNDLLRAIKKSAVEAVEASKPTAIIFGTVILTNPLHIRVGQKLTLTMEQLKLSRNVTTYTITVGMELFTDNTIHTHSYRDDGQSLMTGSNHHNHPMTGIKLITIHNGLAIGDEVIMVRMQGGQQFVVIDRVGV